MTKALSPSQKLCKYGKTIAFNLVGYELGINDHPTLA